MINSTKLNTPHGSANTWRCGSYTLDLSTPRIMGVVNVTPDSFSDGGQFLDAATAIAHAHRLIDEGADIIDVGGESTRPGAAGVDVEEELRRVMPVLRALRHAPVPVAIDTVKPAVMCAALAEGVCIVNDINALRAQGAIDALTGNDAGVCLMHMQGEPRTMQSAPRYEDVVGEVRDFLCERVLSAAAAGIALERIAIDPGFGFGKTVEHNLALLRGLDQLCALGRPVLAGLSRKSTLGAITGRVASDRDAASIAAALLAVQQGAKIVRVHDVAATRDALAVLAAVKGSAQ